MIGKIVGSYCRCLGAADVDFGVESDLRFRRGDDGHAGVWCLSGRAFRTGQDLCVQRQKMAVNKEQRYQAVGELIKDLTAHQEGLPVSAYTAPLYVRIAKFSKRNPIKTSAILSCIIAIFTYLMVSSFLDSLYFKRTMKQVQVSVATAEFKLDNLDKRLEKEAARPLGSAISDDKEGELTPERYNDLHAAIFWAAAWAVSSFVAQMARFAPWRAS